MKKSSIPTGYAKAKVLTKAGEKDSKLKQRSGKSPTKSLKELLEAKEPELNSIEELKEPDEVKETIDAVDALDEKDAKDLKIQAAGPPRPAEVPEAPAQSQPDPKAGPTAEPSIRPASPSPASPPGAAEPAEPAEPTPESTFISPAVSPIKEANRVLRSRNSQKSLTESKISSELDKIFCQSPSKPLRPSFNQGSSRHLTVSSSPLKTINSSGSLLIKKEPIFEQLYKIVNKPRPEVVDDRSKKISPTRKRAEVDKDLYEDAVRRATIHYEKDECSEFTTGIKSQQVLVKKFSNEFLAVVESLQVYSMGFEAFLMVMKELRFVKDDIDEPIMALKFWNTINDQNTEKIQLEKTLASLLALIGIYSSQVVNSSLVLPKALNYVLVASALPIHLEMRIHKSFHRFNENRRVPVHKTSQSTGSAFTFAPQLNVKSQTLAKKKYDQLGGLSPIKKVEYYLGLKKKKIEIAEREKLQKQEKEMENCTFVPKILKKGASPAKSLVHKTLELYEKAKKNFVKRGGEAKESGNDLEEGKKTEGNLPGEPAGREGEGKEDVKENEVKVSE